MTAANATVAAAGVIEPRSFAPGVEPPADEVNDRAGEADGQDDEDGGGVRDKRRLLPHRRKERHDDHAAAPAENAVDGACGTARGAQRQFAFRSFQNSKPPYIFLSFAYSLRRS